MDKTRESQSYHANIGSFSRFLRLLRRKIILYYYRYSVEIGVSVLEGWEAFIVNSVFLLLIVSIVKQIARALLFFFSYLYNLLQGK
jgi:hypothetical protein